LLASLLRHENHGAVESKDDFLKAFDAAENAGLKRAAWEALVWRLHRMNERGEEGADDVASMILSRSVSPWTNGGRALALAVHALAQQDLDQARQAECLVSLPGRRPWRLGALRTLSTLGALMDPELKRRVERLVTVVDAA
jgi:hypothetical protein